MDKISPQSDETTENLIARSILSPLTHTLRLTSVPITRNRTLTTKLCTASCLIVCTQACVYSVYLHFSVKLTPKNNSTGFLSFYDKLLIAFKLESLILDLATYYALVVKLGPFLDLLWEQCKTLIRQLTQRETRVLKSLSWASLIYLAMTVLLNIVLQIVWMLQGGPQFWESVQKVIRYITNRWFHAAIVWLFGLCALLLIAICDATLHDLASCNDSSSIMRKIDTIRRLVNIANWMTSELGFMLFGNVCSSLFFMLVYAVLSVLHVINKESYWSIGLVWDLTDVCDAFLRMWLVSHSADLLRSIARRSYPVLRELRDSSQISIDKRRKITLSIIELSRLDGRTVDPLLGLVHIGKKNILGLVHTIITYGVIIYQATQAYG